LHFICFYYNINLYRINLLFLRMNGMKLELLSRPDYAQTQQYNEIPKMDTIDNYAPNIVQFGSLKKPDDSASVKVINDTVSKVNKLIANTGTTLEMSIYEPTHEVQVKIKDSEGKVIKEIPSEKMLELGAYMRKLAGIMVDKSI
jgi:flagellar protein FlaG